MLLNCGVGENSWEFLGLQGNPISQSYRRSVLNVHWINWCWSWNSNTLATWCEVLTHLKRPWCWERLKAWGEGDDRGWDGWMSSLTQWTWVWVNSRSWSWTRIPGVLWSMGSQRVGHNWATELNWTEPGGTVGKEPVCQYRRHDKWIWSLGWKFLLILEHPQNNVSPCFHCFPISLPYKDLVWDHKDPMWRK